MMLDLRNIIKGIFSDGGRVAAPSDDAIPFISDAEQQHGLPASYLLVLLALSTLALAILIRTITMGDTADEPPSPSPELRPESTTPYQGSTTPDQGSRLDPPTPETEQWVAARTSMSISPGMSCEDTEPPSHGTSSWRSPSTSSARRASEDEWVGQYEQEGELL